MNTCMQTDNDILNTKDSLEVVGGVFSNYSLDKFKVKKPSKNEERKRLIEKISEATGWSKKSVHFQTLHFPDTWLQDALQACLHFTEQKTRNYHFKEFIKGTKIWTHGT